MIESVISIGLNIFYFLEIKSALEPIKYNDSASFIVTRIFGFGGGDYGSDTLEICKSGSEEEALVIEATDKILDRLYSLQDGLVGTSGGIDPETGELMNGGSTAHNYQFFFAENNFNSYGIKSFNSIVNDYFETMDSLNINSRIPGRIKRFDEYTDDTLFYNMTVTEAFNFIELLKSHVVIDKYIYLAKNCEKE